MSTRTLGHCSRCPLKLASLVTRVESGRASILVVVQIVLQCGYSQWYRLATGEAGRVFLLESFQTVNVEFVVNCPLFGQAQGDRDVPVDRCDREWSLVLWRQLSGASARS